MSKEDLDEKFVQGVIDEDEYYASITFLATR